MINILISYLITFVKFLILFIQIMKIMKTALRFIAKMIVIDNDKNIRNILGPMKSDIAKLILKKQ